MAAKKKKKQPAKKTAAKKSPAKKASKKKAAARKLTLDQRISEMVDGDVNVARASEEMWSKPKYWISTRSLALDRALGGRGVPGGRMVELYGPWGCLDGDTFIQYEVRTADGRRINHKGGTIRRLWERFHGEPASGDGRGKYLRPQSIGARFYATSINEDDRFLKNEILNVVRSGTKECFELVTVGGAEIVASADHRFFTGSAYVKLQDLEPGAEILMHTNTRTKRERDLPRSPKRRAYLTVKSHPVADYHPVTEPTTGKVYDYYRLARSRAVVEAWINGLSLEQYVARLNTGELDGLEFLDRDRHVHHRDEDCLNDDRENLVVVDGREHNRRHALESPNNLRFMATEDVVASIRPVGQRETFDLQMAPPFHNFVANKFVTHNSSKSTIADCCGVQTQEDGGLVGLFDTEKGRDEDYMLALGYDMKRLIRFEGDDVMTIEGIGRKLEEYADKFREVLGPGRPILFIWDTLAGTPSMAEWAANIGDQHRAVAAKAVKALMRKLTVTLARTQSTLIVVNQVYNAMSTYGTKRVPYGGDGVAYHASQRVDFLEVGRLMPRGVSKEDKADPEGIIVNARVIKNKVAPPNRQARYAVKYGEGIRNDFSIWWDNCPQPTSSNKNPKPPPGAFITQSGSWFRLDPRFGDFPAWQGGYHGLAELVAENPGLWDQLVDAYKALGTEP